MKESRGITPLRTILQNCLNHIENLETNRSISDNYDKEFQDLKQFSETLKAQKEFSCTEGEKEVNRKKNRYKDILPFNVSRVILSEYAGIPGSDYINANFIKGASGSPAYIASQGPLPNTVNDFWRMVVECEVQVIVMACNAQESGKHKCENYWVEKEGEEKRFGMVQICLVKASTVCPDFLVRTMRLKYTNDKDVTEERTVCQFHYSAWPDHGVPPLVRPLLDMVRLVRDTQASETLPVLVHCSAGCGRTGTICAIDFVWGLLRAGVPLPTIAGKKEAYGFVNQIVLRLELHTPNKLTEEFSLFNLVKDMRKQRVAMVQTKEQYILVHQAVRELFKEQLRVIESHPYENIDFNGVPLIKDFEEPFYDTICIQKEENCDEKQDKSEVKEKGEEIDSRFPKADTAPPLPRKKRPNVLFSKQEKEAENLTEKNRSSFAEKEREREKTDASLGGILGKPRIVKLRALFERSPTAKERTALKDRGSQTVSRSHSLGAIRKPFTAEVFEPQTDKNKPVNPPPQPVPESVKLKHSKSFSKSVPLIKRSKSLKTFSQSPHLCVSPPNTVDRKLVKYQPKPPESNDVNTRKVSPYDIPQDLTKECSRRRRSLESLMGDVPPSITWPTVVMKAEKSSSKTRQKSLDWSPKQTSNTIHGSRTSELIRQQLQRLSLETEKKMSNYASGIGIRERRNSFRQAVSKNDFHNVFRESRDHGSFGKKLVGGENAHPHWDGSKSVKNSSEFLQLIDQPDGLGYLEREGVDVKELKVKGVFDSKKYKPSIGNDKSISSKHPTQNSIVTVNRQVFPEPRTVKGILSKRPGEDSERSSDPKNLFLKKLNSELLSERERDSGNSSQHSESRSRSSHEDSDKSSRFGSSSIFIHSDSKNSLFKSNSVKHIPQSYSIKIDNFDDFDGPNRKEMENTRQNSNSHSHQIYVKPHRPSKPLDCYKCYTAPPPPQPVSYSKANPPHKSLNYQNSLGEGTSNMRRDEMPQEVRHKEPFFSISHKKSLCGVIPGKIHSSHENEVPFGSYRRNPNSDLYVPEFEANDKKMMLPPKMSVAEKSKNYDCIPWSHSGSQRSSGELTSDSKSDSPRLYESDSSIKPEVKIIKKQDQGKSIVKIRVNDSRVSPNCEQPVGLGKQKKAEDPKGNSVDFVSYGVVGPSKARITSSKYSKDDFLLEEPTAPPRVKRHASVTVPRNAVNGSDRGSPWIASEKQLATGRNPNLQVDANAWSGSFGVDLDAVAASMQQDKKEPAVLKDAVWSSKNLTTSTTSNVKKKQHYF